MASSEKTGMSAAFMQAAKQGLKLVTIDDESAPVVINGSGAVLTRFKTGDYIINSSTKGKTVIEGLLRVGDVYILGSDEKAGKSRSSHVAAYRIASGKSFIDYPVPSPCDVLFVEQDESQEDSSETLTDAIELGYLTEEEVRSDKVTYYNDFDDKGQRSAHRSFVFEEVLTGDKESRVLRIRTDCGLGQVLRDWKVTHEKGALAIIDSLSDVLDATHSLGVSQRDDKAIAAAFSSLAHELGIAIILIHHTTKYHGEGSISDRMQGTRGLLAGVTGTIMFEPAYDQGAWTGKGVLVVKGRCGLRSIPISSEHGFWRSEAASAPKEYAPDDVVKAAYEWMISRDDGWEGTSKDLVSEAKLGCDYRQVSRLLKRGSEWLEQHGVLFRIAPLRHGYRRLTLGLTPLGHKAAEAKREEFRGLETIAKAAFGNEVVAEYSVAGA